MKIIIALTVLLYLYNYTRLRENVVSLFKDIITAFVYVIAWVIRLVRIIRGK